MISRRKFVIAAAATLVVPGPGRAGTRPTAPPTTTASPTVNPVLARILSVGCFLENLSQAASAEALDAEITPSEADAAAALGLPGPIQFLIRVGYVDRYPEPVSPRRALASFVNA